MQQQYAIGPYSPVIPELVHLCLYARVFAYLHMCMKGMQPQRRQCGTSGG